MEPVIHTQSGELPRFWDRGVIFFANLLSLFYGNEGQTRELAEHVGGIDSYGGRLIPVLNLIFRRAENLLVLERAPNLDLLEYFAQELDLGLPEMEILHDAEYTALAAGEPDATGDRDTARIGARMLEHPAQWVDGFVTDQRLVDVSKALRKSTITTEDGSKRGNNKYLLHCHLEQLGFLVFETLLASSAEEVPVRLAELRTKGYVRAVLKAQIGASGFGMMRVATAPDPRLDVPDYMFFEGPCLVQGWLDDEVGGVRLLGSPSVQLFLDDERVTLYDLTAQVLSDESIHEGNLAPPPLVAGREKLEDRILYEAAEAGRWLHHQGYRGTGSVDFVVIERGDEVEIRVCEINARVTGATYPSILARHFMPRGAWLMRNLRFRSVLDGGEVLALMREAEVLYQLGAKRGVLPINFNPGPDHEHIVKGQFLCLGTTVSECQDVLEEAERILPVAWDYDRD